MKQKKLKTSDYFIIKVRSYASEYHLKKWHTTDNQESYQKHREACDKHRAFFWQFFEHLTNITKEAFQHDYTNSSECAIEEMEASYNVMINPREGWWYYLIPKTNIELIQWMKDNTTHIKTQVISHMQICLEYHLPATWKREHFKNNWKEFYEKNK